MSRVALLGIPDDLGGELAQVLRSESHQVSRKLYVQDLQRGVKADIVFISGDDSDFQNTIRLLREAEPRLPIVAVTREPGAARWLDALEAGANDYCGAPFDRLQVQWIMSALVANARSAAA